jgi:molybdopterin synthase sulfur carrier subunit
LKAVYFAWVRERIGKAEEELDPPSPITTVEGLIAWLSRQGEGYAHAFENPATIRTAIDHVHARHDAPLAGAREIAFFPPMTGG